MLAELGLNMLGGRHWV